MAKYPKAQLTQNMCKTFKEQYGFVSDTKDKVEVMIPVDGTPTPHDITERLKQACEILIDADRRRHPQAGQQLQPGIPGEAPSQRAALGRRRLDARLEQAHRRSHEGDRRRHASRSSKSRCTPAPTAPSSLAMDMPGEYWQQLR